MSHLWQCRNGTQYQPDRATNSIHSIHFHHQQCSGSVPLTLQSINLYWYCPTHLRFKLLSMNKFLVLTVIMLSSSVRAFTSSFRTINSRKPFVLSSSGRPNPTLISRFMTGETEETTIVTTCREKIMSALETENVKVTGMWTLSREICISSLR